MSAPFHWLDIIRHCCRVQGTRAGWRFQDTRLIRSPCLSDVDRILQNHLKLLVEPGRYSVGSICPFKQLSSESSYYYLANMHYRLCIWIYWGNYWSVVCRLAKSINPFMYFITSVTQTWHFVFYLCWSEEKFLSFMPSRLDSLCVKKINGRYGSLRL